MFHTDEEREQIQKISDDHMAWMHEHRNEVFDEMRGLMPEAISAWGAYKCLREDVVRTTSHREYFNRVMDKYLQVRHEYMVADAS